MSWDDVRQRSGMTAEQLEAYRTARGFGEQQVALRGELTERAPYTQPYYWAAFILVGDPE